MKLLMRDEAKGKEHTIFVTIFAALMVMLVIMVMLMASAIGVSGVTLRLDENAVDILDKQVENRARYIETQLQQAQDLTELSSFINDTARQMLDEGTLSLSIRWILPAARACPCWKRPLRGCSRHSAPSRSAASSSS